MTYSNSRTQLRILIALILVTTAAFCAAPCRDMIPARECEAIAGLATFTLPPPEMTDAVLDFLGFPAEKRPANWNELAPLRKWEVAWISAQHGTPDGGSRLIEEAVSYFSKRYESASIITGVVPRISLGRIAMPLTFEVFRPRNDVIPDEVAHTLKLLVEYSGGVGGGIYGVLMDGLGLSEVEASRAMQDSASREDALALGLRSVPPALREERIRKIVALIDERYPKTALAHWEFDAFRRNPPERFPELRRKLPSIVVESEHGSWDEWSAALLKALRHRL